MSHQPAPHDVHMTEEEDLSSTQHSDSREDSVQESSVQESSVQRISDDENDTDEFQYPVASSDYNLAVASVGRTSGGYDFNEDEGEEEGVEEENVADQTDMDAPDHSSQPNLEPSHSIEDDPNESPIKFPSTKRVRFDPQQVGEAEFSQSLTAENDDPPSTSHLDQYQEHEDDGLHEDHHELSEEQHTPIHDAHQQHFHTLNPLSPESVEARLRQYEEEAMREARGEAIETEIISAAASSSQSIAAPPASSMPQPTSTLLAEDRAQAAVEPNDAAPSSAASESASSANAATANAVATATTPVTPAKPTSGGSHTRNPSPRTSFYTSFPVGQFLLDSIQSIPFFQTLQNESWKEQTREEEVKHLRDLVMHLTEGMELGEDSGRKARKELVVVQNQLRQLETQRQSLEQELQVAQGLLLAKDALLAEASLAKDQMQHHLEQTNAETAAKKERMQQLQEQTVAEVSLEKEQMRQEFDSTLTEMKSKLQEKDIQLSELASLKEQLDQTREELQREKDAAQESIRSSQATQAQLTELNTSQTKEIEQLHLFLSAARSDLANSEQALMQLQERVELATAKEQEHLEKITRLQQEHETERTKLQQQQSELQTALDTATTQHAAEFLTLNQQLQSLQSQLELSRSEIAGQQSKDSEVQTDVQQQLQRSQAQLTQLQSSLAESQEELESLRTSSDARIAKWQTKYVELEASTRVQLQSKQTKLDTLRSSFDTQLQSKQAELETLRSSFEAQLLTLQSQLTDTTNKFDQFRSSKEEGDTAREEKHQQLEKELKQRLVEVETNLTRVQHENDTLKQQLEALSTASSMGKTDLEIQLQNLTQEHIALTSQSETNVIELQTKHQSELDSLRLASQTELQAKQAELDALRSSFSTAQTELTHTKQQLIDLSARLEHQSASSTQNVEALLAQQIQLREAIERVEMEKKRNDDTTKLLQEASTQLTEAQSSLDTLTLKHETLSAELDQVREENTNLVKRAQQLSTELDQVRTEKIALASQAQEFSVNLDRVREEKVILTTRAQELSIERDHSLETLSQMKQQLSMVQGELETVLQEMDAVRQAKDQFEQHALAAEKEVIESRSVVLKLQESDQARKVQLESEQATLRSLQIERDILIANAAAASSSSGPATDPEQRVKDLTALLNAREDQWADLSERHGALKKDLESTKKELDASNAREQAMQTELAAAHKKCQEMDVILDKRDKKIHTIQSNLAAAEVTFAGEQRKSNEAHQAQEQLWQSKLNQLTEDIQSMKMAHAKALADQEHALESKLTQQAEKHRLEMQTVKAEHANALSEQHRLLITPAAAASSSPTPDQFSTMAATNLAGELALMLSRAQSAERALEESKGALKEEQEKTRIALAESQKELISLHEKRSSSETRNTELQEKVLAAEQAAEIARRELSEAKNKSQQELELLTQQLSTTEELVKALKDEKRDVEQRAAIAMNMKQPSSEANAPPAAAVSHEHLVAQKNLEFVNSNLREELKADKQSLESLTQACAKLRADKAVLEFRVDQAEQQVEGLKPSGAMPSIMSPQSNRFNSPSTKASPTVDTAHRASTAAEVVAPIPIESDSEYSTSRSVSLSLSRTPTRSSVMQGQQGTVAPIPIESESDRSPSRSASFSMSRSTMRPSVDGVDESAWDHAIPLQSTEELQTLQQQNTLLERQLEQTRNELNQAKGELQATAVSNQRQGGLSLQVQAAQLELQEQLETARLDLTRMQKSLAQSNRRAESLQFQLETAHSGRDTDASTELLNTRRNLQQVKAENLALQEQFEQQRDSFKMIQQKLQQLKEEKVVLQEQLDALTSAKDASKMTEQRLQQARTQISSLQEQLEQLSSTRDSSKVTDQRLQQARAENAALQTQLEELASARDAAKMVEQRLKKQLAERDQEIEQVRSELSTATTAAAATKQKFLACEKDLALGREDLESAQRASKGADSLRQKLLSTERDLAQAQESLSEEQHARRSIESKNDSRARADKAALDALEMEVTTTKAALKASQALAESNKQELLSVQTTLEQSQQREQNLTDQLRQARSKHERELEAVKDDLEKLRESQAAENKKHRAEKSEWQAKLDALQSEQEKLERSLSQVTNEREKLRSSLAQLTEEKEAVQSSLARSELEKKQLQSSLTQFDVERSELQSQLASGQAALKALETSSQRSVTRLEEELAHMRKENVDRLEQLRKENAERVEQIRKDHSSRDEEYRKLTRESGEKDASLRSSQSIIHSLEVSLKQLEDRLETSESTIQTQRRALEEARGMVDTIRTEHGKRVDAMLYEDALAKLTQSGEAITALQGKVRILEQQLHASVAQKEKAIQTLTMQHQQALQAAAAQKSQVVARTQQLESQLEQTKRALEESRESTADLSTALQSLRTKLATSEMEQRTMEVELSKMQSLSDRLAELEIEAEQGRVYEVESQALKQEYSTLKNQFTTQAKQWESSLQTLMADLTQSREEVSTHRVQLQELIDIIDHTRDELSSSKAETQRLQNQLLQQELALSTTAKLSSALAAQEHKVKILEQELKHMTIELSHRESLQSDLSKLQTEYLSLGRERDSAIQSAKHAEERLQAERTSSSKQLQDLSANLRTSEQNLRELQEKVTNSDATLVTLKKEHATLHIELATVKQHLTDKTNELAASKQTLKELSSSHLHALEEATRQLRLDLASHDALAEQAMSVAIAEAEQKAAADALVAHAAAGRERVGLEEEIKRLEQLLREKEFDLSQQKSALVDCTQLLQESRASMELLSNRVSHAELERDSAIDRADVFSKRAHALSNQLDTTVQESQRLKKRVWDLQEVVERSRDVHHEQMRQVEQHYHHQPQRTPYINQTPLRASMNGHSSRDENSGSVTRTPYYTRPIEFDTPTSSMTLVRSSSITSAARQLQQSSRQLRRAHVDTRAHVGELMRATFTAMHQDLARGLTHVIRMKLATPSQTHK